MLRQEKPARQAMARDEEKRCIARVQRGHADSFRALVDAYKDRLFAFVWRIVRNHHEAEDICQSAFVKAYESLASYSDQYAFSTWLFTIAYRISLNHLRKKRAWVGQVDFDRLQPAGEDAGRELANSEEAQRLRDVIWAAVDQLSAPQRSAILLFYREGLSCQEISLILGMPPVTVKSHLHRGREKLRQRLSGELVEDWMTIRFLSEQRSA